MSLTKDQLDEAKSIIASQKFEQQTDEMKDLVQSLRDDFEQIITEHLGADIVPGEWLSQNCLIQVAEQAVRSAEDFRHRYPYHVTAIKYVSIVSFWIIKLKPINVMGLRQGEDLVQCSDVNERVAIRWIQKQIWVLLDGNCIPEFLPNSDEVRAKVKEVFQFYFYHNLYDRVNGSGEAGDEYELDPSRNKFYETSYYMRYKKMTAINIYESLIHMFLPVRAGIKAKL